MKTKRNIIYSFLLFFTFVLHFSCQKEEIFVEGGEKDNINPVDTITLGNFAINIVFVSDNAIELSWSVSSNAISYEIALNDSVVAYDVTSFSYLLSGLNSNTEYEITVNALSSTHKKNAQTITIKTKKQLIEAIYSLHLEEYEYCRFSSCIKTTDSGFLLDAYLYRYGVYYQAIIKTDKNLNIKWVDYSVERISHEKQILECKSGGYLIISDNEIFKLDNNGERVWTQNLNTVSDDDYFGLIEGGIESSDGTIVLVGALVKIGGSSTVGVKNLIIKLSATGNIIWNKSEEKNSNSYLDKIIQNNDGSYLIVEETNSSIFSLVGIDKDGSILWEKSYDDINYYLSVNIQSVPDGNYFISGTQPVSDQYGRSGFAPRYMKVAKNGTTIWNNVYRDLNGGGLSPGAGASEVQSDNSYIVLTNDDRGVGLAKLSPSGEVITHLALFGYPSGIYVSAISDNQCIYFTDNGYFIIVNWDGYINTY